MEGFEHDLTFIRKVCSGCCVEHRGQGWKQGTCKEAKGDHGLDSEVAPEVVRSGGRFYVYFKRETLSTEPRSEVLRISVADCKNGHQFFSSLYS